MAAVPINDSWEIGDHYEQYVGRWSRRVAQRFLAWLDVPEGQRWLDVGCGTGALSDAVLCQCAPSSVTGVEPSAGFLQKARAQLEGRVRLLQGTANEIPLHTDAADVTVSGLVLNFVPDARAALAEMARVTAPGGIIAAYVWDYSGKMELMRRFWDAAVELDSSAAKLDEGARFALCRPGILHELFAGAQLRAIETTAIDVDTPFSSFMDYWQPFLGGQGPAPSYVMALDEAARGRLRDRIRERMPLQSDGSFMLTARAWAVQAKVAK